MASTLYFLVFSGFIITFIQLVTSEYSNEWDVERSSVNPLSYTDEGHYSFAGTTKSPLLRSKKRTDCPENENFSLCDANCETTCKNYKKPIVCPKFCLWGCVCKPGLVRGPNKKCIKREECPSKQQAEVQQNFLTHLKDTQPEETDNSANSEKENPPASKSNLWPLPPMFCGKNEVFDMLPITCPDDCNNFRKKNETCIPIPSCVCKKGFVRSPSGKCIEPYECPQEKNFCTNGEVYSPCHSHCEGDCLNKEKDDNCQKNAMLCVPGCTCKEGLIRGVDGTCIYPTECPSDPPTQPPLKVCPRNEEYVEKKADCQRNCSTIDSAISCHPWMNQPGCVCKEPLVRGKYGKCVVKDECPKNNFAEDSYVTLNPSTNTDDNNHIREPVTENSQFDDITTTQNSNSYVTLNPPPYTDDDYHIPETVTNPPKQHSNQFPFPPFRLICGKDEIMDICPNSCQDTCDTINDPQRRCKKGKGLCIPACVCREGFVRGPENKCVEKSKCQVEVNCGKDEMYGGCINCEKNCSNWAMEIDCPTKCIKGCVCRSGRIRGPDKKCIVWNQCLKHSSKYSASRQTLPPYKSEENDGCLNDYACTISCRHYGHRYGHCTGRNRLVCSCYRENEESAEYGVHL